MKRILGLLLAVAAFPAIAADNSVVLTPGSGVTMRSKDIGAGVQSSVVILGDTSGNPLASVPITGTVTGSTANLVVPLSGMNTNNAATQIALQGANSVSASLTGTWSGTLTPQVSNDNGANWYATQFYNPNTQTLITSTISPGIYDIIGTGGKTHARLLLTAYTTGTVTGSLTAAAQAPSENPGAVGTVSDGTYAGSGSASLVSLNKGIYNLLTQPISSCGSLNSCVTIGGTFPVAAPGGGATSYTHDMTGSSTNSTNIKGSAGTLYRFSVDQLGSVAGNLRFYDTTSTPTCSSASNMVAKFWISGATTASSAFEPGGAVGLKFINGISFCFTGAKGSADNTNWGGTTGDVVLNAGYN